MTPRIAITAATGQLGQLVVPALLDRKFPPSSLTVAVRNADRVPKAWTAAGVNVVQIDYDAPQNEWKDALAGQDRLLLVSGLAPHRAQQHETILRGAKDAGVSFVAYTGLLYADKKYLALADDHYATENVMEELAAGESGWTYALLRHGWYTENLLGHADGWKHGVHLSAAPTARISAASRQDYAEADAAIISSDTIEMGPGVKLVYELAGDEGITYDALVAAAGEKLGKEVKHVALGQDDLVKALEENGVPGPAAAFLTSVDVGCEQHGALFNDSKTLSKVIGRPTTPWKETIWAGL